MDVMSQHPDIIDLILETAPSLACRLVCVNQHLKCMLSERAKQQAYLALWNLQDTSIFNRGRDWAQFNALYLLCKRQTIRVVLRRADHKRSQSVRIRKYHFGFYTGRRDEWHKCTLTVTPHASDRGARLRVQSFNGTSADRPYVTRTFDRIFGLGALIRILNEKNWHTFYCICGDRWSYTENQASRLLILGYED